MTAYDGDEVVISGIGGHFPECDNLDELRDNLLGGIDMVTEGRPRWEPGELGVPVRTGKMKSLEKCDAQYFGLIGKQCHALDPITRKVLERTYEAIFDAGLNPSDLSGTKTGVFIGTSILETEMSLMEMKSSDAYNILGRNKTMNANRISYWLDLKGPSFTFDSTWSSGLQAVALGYEYIRSGFCETALVGAGSSIIHSQFSKHFSDLKMLSPDGVPRSFDENANGFARSEAVVVLVLQKLRSARRNYGIIVNAVGRAMNNIPGYILVPKREEWLELYREFYDTCQIDPKTITYVEADSLACRESDIAEANAINEFFCNERDSSQPLLIGSVKTNLGHTLAASGLCALAKILIANQTGLIAPNLHYNSPNKLIPGLISGKMRVVTEPTRMEGELLAVNDFGFGGTYGHCLIRRPPRSSGSGSPPPQIPKLVLLSARNEEGIDSILDKVEQLPYSDETINLIHGLFSKNIAHHMYRGYAILPKGETGFRARESFQGDKRPVWFVLSGMGSHWATMGKDLKRLPLFRESIDFCHNILLKKGLDLWHILTHNDSTMFENVINSFVSISAMQIALIDILNRIGIKPDGIVGHSAGELGASYADGCLTKEEMILSSYSRGKVSTEVNVIKGMMAAVGLGYNEIKDDLPEDIQVACHNSPTSSTISGPSEKVSIFSDKLKEKGIFVKAVNVSNIAFHSKHIRDMGPRLKEELSHVIRNPRRRSPRWVSSSVLQENWGDPKWQICSADYLTNNLLSPVYFEEACRHIPKNAIVIEIAPHSLLLPILKRSLSKECIIIGLTNRNSSDQYLNLLQSIGKLYVAGLQPQISALYPEVKLPVSLDVPFLGSFATWDHSFSWNSKIQGSSNAHCKNAKDFEFFIDQNSQYKCLKFEDRHVLPYSFLLSIVVQVFSDAKKSKLSNVGILLEDIFFRKPIFLGKERSLIFSVTNCIGTGKFEVMMEDEVIATGNIKEIDVKNKGTIQYMSQVRNQKLSMEHKEVYTELIHIGYEYFEPFRTIKRVVNDGSAWEFCLEWKADLTCLMESLIQCLVLAAGACENPREIRLIREISLEPHLLPTCNEELKTNFDEKTGVITTKGVTMKGLLLKARMTLPMGHVPPPLKGNIKISFVDYFGKNIKSGQFGYSGIDSAGSKVMGLGRWDDASCSVETDELLMWKVPDKWNLESAAEIIFPYSLAYYIMKILTHIRDTDSVFVTNGLTTIGLASLSIALRFTNKVYATVSTMEDKKALAKILGKGPNNIFVVEPGREDQLLIDLAATEVKRVSYIINTGPGSQIENYLRCLADFSQLFQIFIEETEEGLQFAGTENLLREATIFGINRSSLLTSAQQDKIKLKNLVDDGIKSGAITPWHLEKPERLPNESPSRFFCKSQNSYLIISGQVQMALQTVEWFIRRNVKKITVVHSDKNITGNVRAKLNAIQERISIKVRQVESFDEEMLKHSLRDLTDPDVALMLPIEDRKESSVLKFLSSHLNPKTHLISVLKSNSKGVDICGDRSHSGKPTSAILWDGLSNGKTRQLVRALDRILGQKSQAVIRIDESDERMDEQKNAEELLHSLPKSADEVSEYGERIPNNVRVTEMKTLSLPMEFAKETLPIFLIEGIRKKRTFVEKFRNSLYPVFVVELPHFGNSSVEELASYAIPKVKAITSGPLIIIGEQWGGCIALELAKQLEHLGDKTHVFLVGGTPVEVKETLKSISTTAETLEVCLISRLLQIKDDKVLQELSNQDWNGKINYCLQFVREEEQSSIRKGLDAIKCRLQTLNKYSLKTPLNGPVTIVTNRDIPSEQCNTLCKMRVDIYKVADREGLLNDNTIRMIHETAVHRTLQV